MTNVPLATSSFGSGTLGTARVRGTCRSAAPRRADSAAGAQQLARDARKLRVPHAAINIPLKTLDRETTQQLERERPVIVYCYDYQ